MLDAAHVALPHYGTRTLPSPDGGEISYETAGSARHKARLSGMNPNHWYPAEWSARLEPGQHVATRFWDAPIALFRGEDGAMGAVEDRCPHRHLPLSMGKVTGCNLVCVYHGWAFDGRGRLQSVEHDTFGRGLPPVGVRHYPVRERYGLIWIFPGDPALAAQVPLPEIPDAEGDGAWSSIHFDFTWKSHHSMVIDNLCNLTHLYTHGNWAPYDATWMVHRRLTGEDVELVWKHTFRPGPMVPLYRLFLTRNGERDMSETHSVYHYPYHVSHQGGARAINLMLPMAADETRVFTLYYWRNIMPRSWPDRLRKRMMDRLVLPLVRPSTVEVYRQDGVTVEAEMAHLDRNFFAPTPEINPAVHLFDRLSSERWQAWLDYRNGSRRELPQMRRVRLLDGFVDYGDCGGSEAMDGNRAERDAPALATG